MDITDLTAELQARAGSVPQQQPGDLHERLAGVHHKVQVRRRRQAGLGAVAVAAVAVGALSLPGMAFNRGAQLPAHPAADTLVKASSPFVARDGDDPLLASVVGRPGQSSVTLRFTPQDLDLRAAFTCSGARSTQVMATLSVSGRTTESFSCGTTEDGGGQSVIDDDPAANRAGWAEYGLAVGKPAVLRLTGPGGLPKLRLGLALYQRSGPRIVVGGHRFQKAITLDGRRFEQVGAASVEIGKEDSGAVSVDSLLPVGQPAVACFGLLGGEQKTKVTLAVDGQVQSTVLNAGYSCDPLEQPGDRARVTATSGKGALVLVIYEPAEAGSS